MSHKWGLPKVVVTSYSCLHQQRGKIFLGSSVIPDWPFSVLQHKVSLKTFPCLAVVFGKPEVEVKEVTVPGGADMPANLYAVEVLSCQ